MGVGFTYRFNGGAFNLSGMQVKTRVSHDVICELQYADDCAIVADSPFKLQESLDCLAHVYRALSMQISTEKTEILCQWSCAPPDKQPVL